MIEPKLKDLINRDIDGGLSDDERRRLHQSLRRNAQAKRLHQELTTLQVSLASVRQVNPPVHLANRIRAAVHAGDAAALPSRRWRDVLTRPHGSVRYGWVFMGGFVVGALVLMFIINPVAGPGIADNAAAGSMVIHSHTMSVHAGTTAGTINVDRHSGTSDVTLTLTAPAGVVSRLEFDPSLVGIEAVRGMETVGGNVTIRAGIVELNGAGLQRCTVVFVPRVPGAKVSFALVSPEAEFFRTPVPITD